MLNIPYDKQKIYLSNKLPPIAKYASDYFPDNAKGYTEVKQRLLHQLGLTVVQASKQYHSLTSSWLANCTPAQVFDVYNRILERIMEDATTKKQVKAKFVLSSLRHIACHSLGDKLNDKKPQSMDAICDILDGYYSTYGSLGDSSPGAMSSRGRPHSKPNPPFCTYCKKTGHRAPHCWQAQAQGQTPQSPVQSGSFPVSGQKPAPSNPVQSTSKPVGQSPPIICYICQTPGHKAPQCPNKGSGNTTPGRKPVKHQAVVRVPSRPPVPCLWATLGHHTFPIELDPGAHITVLPKDVVPEEAKTGQSTIIVTAMGQTSDAETAHVSLTVGNHPW